MSKKTLRTILGIIVFAVLFTAVIFNLNIVASACLYVWNLFLSFLLGWRWLLF